MIAWVRAAAGLAALSAVVSVALACRDPEAPGRPSEALGALLPEARGMNLLVVSFDALRVDHLPFHGYARDTAPRLTAFADRSVVFERHYSAAQSTPTSFAALWTGKLPFRVFLGWKLSDDETLARLFRDHGYETAAFTSNIQLLPERGFDRGFDRFELAEQGGDEEVFARVARWLGAEPEPPFFAWVHFLSPHSPYTVMPGSESFYDPDYAGRFRERVPADFEIRTDAELERVVDLYDGEILYADRLFGRLLSLLGDHGLSESTVVIVTADHGEEFLDHGQLQHNNVFNEVIRAPLVVNHPAMTEGIRWQAPSSAVDLYPTLADWFGLADDKPVDGISHLREAPQSRAVVAAAMTHRTDRQLSIERNGVKLHVTCSPEFRTGLFDLAADPAERSDLIRDRPGEARELFAALERIAGGDPCRVMQQAVRGRSAASDLSPERIERLRALGYVQ